MAPLLVATVGLASSVLLYLLPSAAAESYPIQQHAWYKDFYPQPEEYCFNGCDTTVSYITFNYTPVSADPEAYYLNECSNKLLIQSLFHCAQKYCSHREAEAGRNKLAAECEEAGVSLPTWQELLLSEADLNSVPILDSTAAVATADSPLDAPAIPDLDWHALGQRTVNEFYFNWNASFAFTFALIAFWGFVVLVGALHRVGTYIKTPPNRPHRGWWLWTRRNLILPATFNNHHAEAVASTLTIPTRLESIILGIYVLMNFIMCFPGFHLFQGNQYYTANKLQLARYIADRTGFLAIAQLPMVWVFAARNDPLMWLTGWSFATYNRFHRWIARIATLHAIVHSIAYSVFALYSQSWDTSWKDEYWWCGAIATVVMSLMLGASAYIFREKFYDLFLIIHIAMSVFFFVALYYHIRIFSGEFMYYLWPCIAIWAFDRLLRAGRTIFVSVVPRFKNGVKATATYHRATEMVRLDITNFFPERKIVPGLYYYLYTPGGLRGYESHPFTMCSWRRAGTSTPSSLKDERQMSVHDKEVEANIRPLSGDFAEGEIAHTLLVRPYKGMTGRLQKKLLSADVSATSSQETVLLEGPYGEKLDLSGYSDVLVVCGGSGITAAISHSHFLTFENAHTKVHIVWAVPQRHLPDDICANELASLIHTDRVNMTVYLTSAAEHEAHDTQNLVAPPAYEIKFGRPDIEKLMREYRQLASKSLAVVTCGTPQMSDVCRKAVVNVLGEEGVHVGYYNETLLW